MPSISSGLFAVMRSTNCVLWFGARVSAIADVPDWNEVLSRVASKARLPEESVQDSRNRGQGLELLAWLESEGQAEAVVELLEDLDRRAIEAPAAESSAREAHSVFSRFAWQMTVATAYPGVLTRALAGHEKALRLQSVEQALRQVDEPDQDLGVIALRPQVQSGHIAQLNRSLMDRLLRFHHGVFIGFNHDDPDWRLIEERLAALEPGPTHYFCTQGCPIDVQRRITGRTGVKVEDIGEEGLGPWLAELERMSSCENVSLDGQDRQKQQDYAEARKLALRFSPPTRLRSVTRPRSVAETTGSGASAASLAGSEWSLSILDKPEDPVWSTLSVGELTRAGQSALGQKQNDIAVALFRQAVARGDDPRATAFAQWNLAAAYLEQGDNERSDAALARAIALDPLLHPAPGMDLERMWDRSEDENYLRGARNTGDSADNEDSIQRVDLAVARHRPSRNPMIRSYVKQSMERLAQIEHRALVPIRSFRADAVSWVVEHPPLRGQSIRQRMADASLTRDHRELCERLSPVFALLRALFERRFVHGAINLDNIWVDESGEFRLRGFGGGAAKIWSDTSVAIGVSPKEALEKGFGRSEDLLGWSEVLAQLWRYSDHGIKTLPAALQLSEGSRVRASETLESLWQAFSDRIRNTSSHEAVGEAAAGGGRLPWQSAASASAEPGLRRELKAVRAALNRSSSNPEARQGLFDLIEKARAEGCMTVVADGLSVIAQTSQIQSQRHAAYLELAELYEHDLDAPRDAAKLVYSIYTELSEDQAPRAYAALLRVTERSGDWAKLRSYFQEIARRSRHAWVRKRYWLEAADIAQSRLQDPEGALSDQSAAVRQDPKDPELWATLADLQVKQQLWEDAVNSRRRRATLLKDPEQIIAALWPTVDILDERLSKPQAAFDTLKELCVLDSTRDDLHHASIELATRLELWEEVVAQYQRRLGAASPTEGMEIRRAMAKIYHERLADTRAAVDALEPLLADRREDRELAQEVLSLALSKPDAFQTDRYKEINADALAILSELEQDPERRVEVLLERAELLQSINDGLERAVDVYAEIMESSRPGQLSYEISARALSRHYGTLGLFDLQEALWKRCVGESALETPIRVEFAESLYDLYARDDERSEHCRRQLLTLSDLQPQRIKWREMLANWYREHERNEEELAVLEDLRSFEVDSARAANFCLRRAQLQLEDSPQIAQEELEGLLKETLAPETHSEVLSTLAKAYRAQDLELLACDLELVAARAEEDPEERARCLAAVAQSYCSQDGARGPEALEIAREAVALDPGSFALQKLAYELELGEGRGTAAWGHAQELMILAKRDCPDDASLRLDTLRWAYRAAQKADIRGRARELFEQIRAMEGHDLDLWVEILESAYEDRDWPWVRQEIETLLELNGSQLSAQLDTKVRVWLAHASLELDAWEPAEAQLEKALRQSPNHLVASQLWVRVRSHRGSEEALVEAKLDLAKAYRAAAGAEPEKREPHLDGADQEDCDAAHLLATKLDRPKEAIRLWTEVLERRPEHKTALHGLLDLRSARGDWNQALEVLEVLSEHESVASRRAKYCYAAAAIARDELQDDERTIDWMTRVLRADPLHPKAFAATVQYYHDRLDWRKIANVLQTRIDALGESGESEEKMGLCDQLASLYERELKELPAAMVAYERGMACAPATLTKEVRAHRRRKVMKLALEVGLPAMETRALGHGREYLSLSPRDLEAMEDMRELYRRRQDEEGVGQMTQVIRYLDPSTPPATGLSLADAFAGFDIVEQGVALRSSSWRSCLVHPEERPLVTEILSMVWPVLAVRAGVTHENLGISRSRQRNVELDGAGLNGEVARICRLFDLIAPDYFEVPDCEEGIFVGALCEDRQVFLSMVVGGELILDRSNARRLFRLGRALARVQPGRIVSRILTAPGPLAEVLFGVSMLVRPDAQVPIEHWDNAHMYAQSISRLLAPTRLRHLEELFERLSVQTSIDPAAWLRGAEFTAARMGFVLSGGDLSVTESCLQSDHDEPAHVDASALMDDILGFCASDGYRKLRQKLMGREG